jgi:hypothetical protein
MWPLTVAVSMSRSFYRFRYASLLSHGFEAIAVAISTCNTVDLGQINRAFGGGRAIGWAATNRLQSMPGDLGRDIDISVGTRMLAPILGSLFQSSILVDVANVTNRMLPTRSFVIQKLVGFIRRVYTL